MEGTLWGGAKIHQVDVGFEFRCGKMCENVGIPAQLDPYRLRVTR